MLSVPRPIAFFDVDETLIATKSMFDFLAFLGHATDAIDAASIIAEMRRLSETGVDRASINISFWKHFAGLEQEFVRATAREWIDTRQRNDAGFFVRASLDRLQRHRQAGHRLAFVSGSACDILEPLARQLSVDHVLATRLVTDGGRYTGEIVPPVMIGAGKMQAVNRLCAVLDVSPADCFGYGDHISDLPLLEAVGVPVVIGTANGLAVIGRHRGWEVLPGLGDLVEAGVTE